MRRALIPKIPDRLALPGGYTVRVRVVADRQFDRMAKRAGVGDVWAFWYDATVNRGGSIYLRKNRNYGDRWEDFTHELDHAINDYRNWITLRVVDPFRAALLAEQIENAGEAA
jgi:hypothetical protein